MPTLTSCHRASGMAFVGALFALGCGEYGTAPPPSLEGNPGFASGSVTAAITVNTTSDVADFGGAQQVGDLPGPDGKVSLREAMTAANNTSGAQVIRFNIPTGDAGFDGTVFTIRPALNNLGLTDDATTIDGATQTSFTGNSNPAGPEVVINGGLLTAPPGQNGLTIESANNRVHRLVINGFEGFGIVIEGAAASTNTITGCFIGTDAAGALAVPNVNGGVGIVSGARSNRVGGTSSRDRNVVSGNSGSGILITSEANLVQGNFVGTDRTGTAALGNGGSGGVAIDIGGDNNTIGGPSAGARNIIAGNNSAGVSINGTGRPLGNTVLGNFIGTDVTGTVALGNGGGVSIVSDDDELGQRESNNNRIIANLVSGNAGSGILMGGSAPTVGSHDNEVVGNLIGTDVTGMTALGNADDGISIGTGTENRIIGNLISGNNRSGIVSFVGDDNVIRRNLIGTNIRGAPVLGNAEFGVSLGDPSGPAVTGNQVGGIQENQGNLIAGNGADGVLVQGDGDISNSILGNRIFSNGTLGIDLGQDDVVTPNDPGDADTGPNNRMNFPVLTSASTTSERLTMRGTIDTPNPGGVTVEFFANPVPTPGGDPSGHGEGAIFLGRVRPNAQGDFTARLPRVRPGTLISATATDAAGSTSEFSANIAAQQAPGGHDD